MAASEPENDRVYLDSSNLGYFFNPSVKFVTSVTDWLPCCERRGMRIFLPSGEISKIRKDGKVADELLRASELQLVALLLHRDSHNGVRSVAELNVKELLAIVAPVRYRATCG